MINANQELISHKFGTGLSSIQAPIFVYLLNSMECVKSYSMKKSDQRWHDDDDHIFVVIFVLFCDIFCATTFRYFFGILNFIFISFSKRVNWKKWKWNKTKADDTNILISQYLKYQYLKNRPLAPNQNQRLNRLKSQIITEVRNGRTLLTPPYRRYILRLSFDNFSICHRLRVILRDVGLLSSR